MPVDGLPLAVETARMSLRKENNLSSLLVGKSMQCWSWFPSGHAWTMWKVRSLKCAESMLMLSKETTFTGEQRQAEKSSMESQITNYGYQKNIWTNSGTSELWLSDMWSATCNQYHWQWKWGSMSDLHSWYWKVSDLHWWKQSPGEHKQTTWRFWHTFFLFRLWQQGIRKWGRN